jgi:hypothetical protein
MLRPEDTFVGQAPLDGGSTHLTAFDTSANNILTRMYDEALVDGQSTSTDGRQLEPDNRGAEIANVQNCFHFLQSKMGVERGAWSTI